MYNGSQEITIESLSARIITITTCDNCVTTQYKPNWQVVWLWKQLFVILPPKGIRTKQKFRTARYLFEWHSIFRHRIVYFVIHLTCITLNTTSMTIISKFKRILWHFINSRSIRRFRIWLRIEWKYFHGCNNERRYHSNPRFTSFWSSVTLEIL